MKVGVVGDAHGDLSFWKNRILPTLRDTWLDAIVQVGDFGYWEHDISGLKYLHRLDEELLEYGIDVYFIDGNHENHTHLRSIYGRREGNPGIVDVRDHIHYIERGAKWEWEGKKFMGCGGAYSIDRGYRIPGQSWWPEEMVEDVDIARCRGAGKVDVLFVHDCPLGVKPIDVHSQYKEKFPETQVNRHRVTEIMNAARPKLVLHGHWHEFHDDTTEKGVRVIGLECNTGYGKAMAILDTDDLSVTFPLNPDEDHSLTVPMRDE